MSTELDIFQQGTAVATSSRRDDGFSANIAGSAVSTRSIVITNNKLRVMVNGKEILKIDNPYLDVIIVNAAPSVNRMYYAGSYDPKAQKREAPKCWSHDSTVPAADAHEKQAADCASCPQNIAGSGPGTTKACRYHRYIAVVLADDPQGEIYRVKLSATSVFGNGTDERRPFNAYKNYLDANNEGLGTVVSRMIVGEDTSNLGFRPIARLTDEQLAIVRQQSQTDTAKRYITLSVASATHDEDGNEFAPTTQAAPAPQPAPAPKAAEPTEEPIPEPVKRDAKPTPATQPAPSIPDVGDISLDDLVADWSN